MAEPSACLQQKRREEGDLPKVQEGEELSPEQRGANGAPWPSRAQWQEEEGRSRWPAGRPQVPAPVRRALRHPALWPPSSIGPLGPGRRGLGLGHPGTRRQGCQEPSGAGGGSAASPGGRGKCYFCLLLSSGTGCPGRGGQRRPLRLSPAHREFLKDAPGCREDGRRGRGGWAGPPNPPPGGGGGGSRVGEGGGSRRGWPLSGWPEDDGGAGLAQARPRRQPSPWPGGAALGAMLLGSPGGPGPLRA